MESNQNYTPDKALATKNTHSLAPVVICVSGGADSVALLHLALHSSLNIEDGNGEQSLSRNRLAIFHLNHGLRAEEADADEAYVRKLAEEYSLPCKIVRVDVGAYAKDFGGNVENAGREIRYSEAHKYAEELCAMTNSHISDARILTAHTADDRAESFLMNAMRGSSLSGLSSIARRNGIVVRPLLHMTHDELEAYLIDHDIVWCTDKTNKDTSYLRSYVRYKVLSPMKQRAPLASCKISSMCDVLSDENDYMVEQAKRAYHQCCISEGDLCIAHDVKVLTQLHPAILRRVIAQTILKLDSFVRITSRTLKDVIAIIDNKLPSGHIVGNIDVRIEHDRLYMRVAQERQYISVDLPVPGSAEFGPYTIDAERILVDFDNVEEYVRDQCIAGKNKVAFLDTSLLQLEDNEELVLSVGSVQTGDSIQPFGMKGRSKLVSDLLHEARIPSHERHLIPLVKDPKTGAIMCVGGIRTDERYSCRKSTKEFIQLSIRKG